MSKGVPSCSALAGLDAPAEALATNAEVLEETDEAASAPSGRDEAPSPRTDAATL
ncbi:MAG: hypothetical protein OXS33_09515 [bacterium]|nr:hypothetical protein [bacterium]